MFRSRKSGRITLAQLPNWQLVVRMRTKQLSAEVDKWLLRPRHLVVVDEASLAGTFALDTLTEQACNAGAKVVLVGDWAQLSAPGPTGSRSGRCAHTAYKRSAVQ